MSQRDNRVLDRNKLGEKAENNEPLVDTPVLDAWQSMELPLRGPFRENVIKRLRAQVKGRRTVEGLAARISSNVTSPISAAIEEEAEQRVKGQIRDALIDGVNGPRGGRQR